MIPTMNALRNVTFRYNRTKRSSSGIRKTELEAATPTDPDRSDEDLRRRLELAFYPVAMAENIFLFVPNVIGYARVVLALISFYYMPTNYVVACTCYMASALLDAVDGVAARHYNQSTRFGAMLDQLTDRAGTMCLCMTLGAFYPKYLFWFQIVTAIDITCHWLYLHTTILQGKTSHKFIDMSGNPIMRIYYTNKTVLFWMCAGNEAFFASLYLLHFTEGPIIAGIGLIRIIAYISTPIAVVKTIISVIHGFVASLNLSTIDVEERAAIAAKQK